MAITKQVESINQGFRIPYTITCPSLKELLNHLKCNVPDYFDDSVQPWSGPHCRDSPYEFYAFDEVEGIGTNLEVRLRENSALISAVLFPFDSVQRNADDQSLKNFTQKNVLKRMSGADDNALDAQAYTMIAAALMTGLPCANISIGFDYCNQVLRYCSSSGSSFQLRLLNPKRSTVEIAKKEFACFTEKVEKNTREIYTAAKLVRSANMLQACGIRNPLTSEFLDAANDLYARVDRVLGRVGMIGKELKKYDSNQTFE